MVVPVTSADNGYPLHIPIGASGVSGFAQVECLRCLDIKQRGWRYLGVAPDAGMRAIMSAIRGVFDLR